MDTNANTSPRSPQDKPAKKLGGRSGAGFMPGRIANPYGPASPKIRIQAELDICIEEFVARHGREPRRLERNDLEQLARLTVELRKLSTRGSTRTQMQLQYRLLKKQYFPGPIGDDDSDSDSAPSAYTGPSVSAASLKRRTPVKRTPSKRSKP